MATTRKPNTRSSAPVVLPADVRVMNAVAALIFAGLLLALLWQTVKWATRSPRFTVNAIVLDAALHKSSVAALRTTALPRLQGNFFSLDLDAARAAFEAVPWVRRAVVRRVWPNRLAVSLEEHEAAALWQGDGRRDERLVNTFGEVFEASVGDVDDAVLPTLAGADANSSQMLMLQQRLTQALAPVGHSVRALRLSARGSWRAELDNGARLELGRGSEDELLARVDRFVRTLPTVAARLPDNHGTPRALLAADLRHPDGYALRLAGITTSATK
jgi:cell division protein FtsQ